MGNIWNNFKKYPNLKIIYFLNSSALSCVQPFISVYLHSFKKIEPSIIGVITCLIPFLQFIGSPLGTGIADRYKIPKLVLVFSCIITIISLLLLIPTKDNLYGIFIIIGVYSISQAPIGPIVDSFVLKELDKDSKLYGQQRLWGAVGWGLISFITGIFIEKISIYSIFIFSSFWMILYVIFIIFSFKKSNLIIENINIDNELIESSSESSKSNSPILNSFNDEEDSKMNLIEKDEIQIIQEKFTIGKVIKSIFGNPHMFIFLFTMMICGMTGNIIATFLFLYLQDIKHASNILLGSTMPFTVVMELPVFFYGDKFLTIIGPNKMIIVGHLAFIIRLCLYNILNIDSVSPWFVLPIEILHGVAYATIWSAGIEISNNMAPKGFETIYQGIFSGVYCGLGAGLGSIIGGFLYQHESPIFLFRFTAISTTTSLIIFSLSQLYFSRKEKRNLEIIYNIDNNIISS